MQLCCIKYISYYQKTFTSNIISIARARGTLAIPIHIDGFLMKAFVNLPEM